MRAEDPASWVVGSTSRTIVQYPYKYLCFRMTGCRFARRCAGPSNNFFELVCDGNTSLIRAVEKFDFSRGNKFSTYASWAIMKNFARIIPEENDHV